jgi:hypothetical protein
MKICPLLGNGHWLRSRYRIVVARMFLTTATIAITIIPIIMDLTTTVMAMPIIVIPLIIMWQTMIEKVVSIKKAAFIEKVLPKMCHVVDNTGYLCQ